jgi:hypothetical protein
LTGSSLFEWAELGLYLIEPTSLTRFEPIGPSREIVFPTETRPVLGTDILLLHFSLFRFLHCRLFFLLLHLSETLLSFQSSETLTFLKSFLTMSSSCSESASSREPNTSPHSHDEEDEVLHADDGSVEAEGDGARVEEEVPPIEDGARVPISYLPIERTVDPSLTPADEPRLRHNFDIPPEVHLHFKDPQGNFIGGEVCLVDKMFMAGLRLPFPAIAREFLEYLQVAPSQIVPNGWRYFLCGIHIMAHDSRGTANVHSGIFLHLPSATVPRWNHWLPSSDQATLSELAF